jgi:hypothetical protein
MKGREDTFLLKSCLKFFIIGLGSLSRTATVINRICTTSNASTNSSGGGSYMSHVWRLMFSGSQAAGEHWSREMSKPMNWTVGGNLRETSRSQILFSARGLVLERVARAERECTRCQWRRLRFGCGWG